MTDTTKTIIDHISTNRGEYYNMFGCLDLGLTDHNLVFTMRKKLKAKEEVTYVWARSYRNYVKEAFAADVSQIDWSPVILCNDTETSVSRFYALLLEVIDYHAPFKFIECEGDELAWITNEFLGLIDECIFWQRKYNKQQTVENKIRRDNARQAVQIMKTEL